MILQINFTSGKPVYLQVVDQVKAAAASGAARAGEPLPSIRPLAEQLRVNRNTVAKAYAELEGQGVIETLAGRGCFLKGTIRRFRKDVRLRWWRRKSMPPSSQAHHLRVEQEGVPGAGQGTLGIVRQTARARSQSE